MTNHYTHKLLHSLPSVEMPSAEDANDTQRPTSDQGTENRDCGRISPEEYI